MSDLRDHFAEEAWFDFVRGFLGTEEAEQMQTHLNDNCESCLEAYRSWSLVMETASREALYQVPDRAVRLVKSAFRLREKVSMLSQIAQMAEAISDSFRQPLPAGFRAGTAHPRHLLHEAGDFQIDLRIETESGKRSTLAGQILHTSAVAGITAGTGIVLVQGEDQAVAQVIANLFGEFQMEFEYGGGLRLYFDVPGQALIGVALPDPSAPTPPTRGPAQFH